MNTKRFVFSEAVKTEAHSWILKMFEVLTYPDKNDYFSY